MIIPIPNPILPAKLFPKPEESGFMRRKKAIEADQPEKKGRFMTENRAIEGTTVDTTLCKFQMAVEKVLQGRKDGRFMTGNRAIQGSTAQGAQFSQLKMAHDDADSVDGIIIKSDNPTPKRITMDHRELKTTKLKKKKAKRVPKPFPIPDLIVPVELDPE